MSLQDLAHKVLNLRQVLLLGEVVKLLPPLLPIKLTHCQTKLQPRIFELILIEKDLDSRESERKLSNKDILTLKTRKHEMIVCINNSYVIFLIKFD